MFYFKSLSNAHVPPQRIILQLKGCMKHWSIGIPQHINIWSAAQYYQSPIPENKEGTNGCMILVFTPKYIASCL